jgi:hypothetical protein
MRIPQLGVKFRFCAIHGFSKQGRIPLITQSKQRFPFSLGARIDPRPRLTSILHRCETKFFSETLPNEAVEAVMTKLTGAMNFPCAFITFSFCLDRNLLKGKYPTTAYGFGHYP